MADDDADRRAVAVLRDVGLGDWSGLIDDVADELDDIYGAGLVEGLALTGMGVSVDAVNSRAIAWARERAASLVTAIEENTREELRVTVATGIEEGWSAAQLADEIAKSPAFDDDRALMIARTECLTGETAVSGAVIRAAFRRWYHGEIVEVVTAEGRKFAATPNHPMLTRRGWIAAGDITESDYLICDARQKNLSSHRDQHINGSPTTVAELFNSLSIAGTLEGRAGDSLDFHGDGRKSDVEIARLDRELHLGLFASLYEPIIKNLLTPSHDMGHADFCTLCSRLLPINQGPCLCERANFNTSLNKPITNRAITAKAVISHEGFYRSARFVGGYEFFDGDDVSVAWSPLMGESQRGGFAAISGGSLGTHQIEDITLIDTSSFSDGVTAHPILIKCDRVLTLRRRVFSGHVYNLETECGYFTITGGIYTGNTLAANNQGNMQGYRDARSAGVRVMKEWLTAGDDLVSEECAENEDEGPIDLDDDFPSGDGEPPAHPNCRCSVTPYLPDEEDEED